MRNLAKFFSVLQLTREQPQYGYFLIGIRANETSNLAEHHYLVTMLGWLLCEYINAEERLVNVDEVIRMSLVHDLGELFGGDVASPLSRKRPDIKEHAKAIESANMDILGRLLSEKLRREFVRLQQASEERKTDEAQIAKLVDLLETQYFLDHTKVKDQQKAVFYANHIRPIIERIQSQKIRQKLAEFLQAYESEVKDRGFLAGDIILGL